MKTLQPAAGEAVKGDGGGRPDDEGYGRSARCYEQGVLGGAPNLRLVEQALVPHQRESLPAALEPGSVEGVHDQDDDGQIEEEEDR